MESAALHHWFDHFWWHFFLFMQKIKYHKFFLVRFFFYSWNDSITLCNFVIDFSRKYSNWCIHTNGNQCKWHWHTCTLCIGFTVQIIKLVTITWDTSKYIDRASFFLRSTITLWHLAQKWSEKKKQKKIKKWKQDKDRQKRK